MQFQVGDKAVVPSQGVGVIKEISKINVGPEAVEMYVIKLLDSGATFFVPVHATDQNNVREVMSVGMIEQVNEVLKDREKPADKQTWNRRYREYTNRIKTGDPVEVAHVLRDLAILRSEKTLSFGERKMYDQAHGLLVQEIAVARDVDEEQVKAELEQLFAEADAAAATKVKPSRKKKKSEDDEGDESDEGDDD